MKSKTSKYLLLALSILLIVGCGTIEVTGEIEGEWVSVIYDCTEPETLEHSEFCDVFAERQLDSWRVEAKCPN